MRELRFDGLSPDGSQLVLAGKDGQRYAVTIDEKLEAGRLVDEQARTELATLMAELGELVAAVGEPEDELVAV